jgi:hypothetical protein
VFEAVSRESVTVRDVDEIEISVESPRARAWEEYFNRLNGSISGGDLSRSGDTVTLEIDDFEGGDGTVSHRGWLIRTEVSSR